MRLWQKSLSVLGGYVDGVHDFGSHTSRVSPGPEAVYQFVGLDVGPVIELGTVQNTFGVRARAFGSIGFGSVYIGELLVPDGAESRWTTEAGVLLKWPFEVAHGGS